MSKRGKKRMNISLLIHLTTVLASEPIEGKVIGASIALILFKFHFISFIWAFSSEEKVEDLVVYNQGGVSLRSSYEFRSEEDEVECKNCLAVVLTRSSSRTYFYSTLNLKHLRSFYPRSHSRRHPSKVEISDVGMGHKAELAHVGSKVLPICDETLPMAEKRGVHKGAKGRAISRMKELLRWAATSNSEKGGHKGWKVSYFRSKGTTKTSFDELSTSSSKISFRWDVGSCSTSSSKSHSLFSVASSSGNDRAVTKESSNSAAVASNFEFKTKKTDDFPRTGNWITSDSDFVVLEL